MNRLSKAVRRVKPFVLERIASRRHDVRLATPACSITFDDVPVSALHNGVPILERHGANATFYVASGLTPEEGFLSHADVRSLAGSGFDIACHTYSHYRLGSGTAEELARDAARNRDALRSDIGVDYPRDFSYPYGEVSPAAKRLLGPAYRTLRSVYEGINGRSTDRTLLRANPLFSHATDWSRIRTLLRMAVAQRAWVIFYTHGVEPSPDRWSCTPQDFDRLLRECTDAGVAFRSVRSVSEEIDREA